MAMYDTLTTTVRAKDAKTAATMVADYRENGGGSNRTDWARLENLLAAVLTVIATGTPVNVTDLFAGGTGKAYHVAHRALSQNLLREYWDRVQVVALKGAEWSGRTVTGETDTVRGTTVLISPVA